MRTQSLAARFRWRFLMTWFGLALAAGAPPAAAAEATGTLHLTGLTAGSRVYVDGRAVVVRAGMVVLPAGTHEVQVESFVPQRDYSVDRAKAVDERRPDLIAYPNGVMVFRRCVTVTAGQTLVAAVKPVPIFPTTSAYATGVSWGPLGPPGAPGPPADPKRPLDAESAKDELRRALDARLRALEMELGGTQISKETYQEWADAPFNYWYNPTGEEARVLNLPFVGCLAGPVGPPGMAGDVLRLKDEKGVTALQRVESELQLNEIKRALAALKMRFQSLTRAHNSAETLRPIPVYTPAWRTVLNEQFLRDSRRQRADRTVGTPVPDMMISSGATGPDGIVSFSAAEAAALTVTLSETQIARLAAALQAEPGIRDRVATVRKHIETLSALAQAAEARKTDAVACTTPRPAQNATLAPDLQQALRTGDTEQLKEFYQRFVASLSFETLILKLPAAVNLAKAPDADDRLRGVAALGASGDMRAIPWIVPLLEDKEVGVRLAAGAALRKLVAHATAPPVDGKARSAKAGPDLRPLAWLLLRMLHGEDKALQSAAIFMTSDIGLTEFLPELDRLAWEQADDSTPERKAIEVLRQRLKNL